MWVTADVSSVLPKGMEMDGSEVSQGELRGFQKYIQCWFAGALRRNGGLGGMMSLLPELVITGGNGGVEGYPGVAFVWLQSVHVELKPALGLSENNSLCWRND